MDTLCLKTPLGALTLFATKDAITALCWGEGANAPKQTQNQLLKRAAELLDSYFKTGEDNFSSLTFDPHGTDFQKRVWAEMAKIEHGKTKSYGDIAKLVNSGPRAVGGACGANPIPILIPCHRIITATGKIGHYSGGNGAETKRILLRLEGTIQ
ncbi:MAG: methylated-DNA--[protein]-cysteine S-methyltransferase [Magnetovibrio sp.]|nr:methylated-DNA--[protein]-cysteine S-methyltransferase [Magnetovibrio sp.]